MQDVDISRLLVSKVPRQKLELNLEGVDWYISELPTFCPRCRKSALGEVYGKASLTYSDGYGEGYRAIEVALRCVLCHELYVGIYNCWWVEVEDNEDSGWSDPSFIATVPAAIAPTLPSKTIMKIAPSFSKIFDETAAAELAGLTELLGAGYRRALEALVKEYLVFKNPARADVYKRTALANCIKDHIDHETIKELAEKAVSVGNDFTHFERRGVHEIADLKGLIALVRRWIELQEETALVRARLISPDARPPELRAGSVVDDLRDDFRFESTENDRE